MYFRGSARLLKYAQFATSSSATIAARRPHDPALHAASTA
jgi:hypothetical protein